MIHQSVSIDRGMVFSISLTLWNPYHHTDADDPMAVYEFLVWHGFRLELRGRDDQIRVLAWGKPKHGDRLRGSKGKCKRHDRHAQLGMVPNCQSMKIKDCILWLSSVEQKLFVALPSLSCLAFQLWGCWKVRAVVTRIPVVCTSEKSSRTDDWSWLHPRYDVQNRPGGLEHMRITPPCRFTWPFCCSKSGS